MMSSVWTCRICGTYLCILLVGLSAMYRNVGLELQEFGNGDRSLMVVIGVLGGEVMTPTGRTSMEKGEVQKS